MTPTVPRHRPGDTTSLLGDADLHLFNEGTHYRLYDRLGAHLIAGGVQFGVWAPSAERVSVIGDFNGWAAGRDPLTPRGSSGIWEGFVPELAPGAVYKYHIESHHRGYRVDKADPFGFVHELPPRTASVVAELDYRWEDGEWMAQRAARSFLEAPISIYEVHLGSWRRDPARPDELLGYRDLAPQLADYCRQQGFTHVELMPIMEHPFYGSWGYQVTGFFAASSRYGSPRDLMYLIDTLHQAGIGVILDWVPSHFPADEHGLGYFDGTHLYEHEDPRQGFHPDWGSLIFNYGRNEVRSFLISSAMFWLDRYHADGLRVDAVASMLYLDYARTNGEWIPNQYGGRENLAAIGFLRLLNEACHREQPGVLMMAEESTAWPMVSRPTYVGGLGFGLKWDMGWMHDTLRYFTHEPVHRKYHSDELTFRSIYAFHENFVLPLSHDEVVHGKGSLLGKMPGDDWQRFANLRLLYAYMFATPGKKLLFQGAELAQWAEWNHDRSLDWHLLDFALHAGMQRLIRELNRVYRDYPALHERDCDPSGFCWIDASDVEHSVLAFSRRNADDRQHVACIFNFTPVPRHNYRIGVEFLGRWAEILNTDAGEFAGSGHGNMGGVEATTVKWHGRPFSINVTLPPLAGIMLAASRE